MVWELRMKIIYLLIIFLPLVVEFNTNINTDGVIRKVALGMLSVGGVLALNGHGESIICLAIAMMYIEKLIFNLVRKYKERHPQNGALL